MKIKYPYSKKFVNAALALALLATPLAGTGVAQAAGTSAAATTTAVAKSNVELTITDGKGIAIDPSLITLLNSKGEQVALTPSTDSKKYTNLSVDSGEYTLVIKNAKVKMTTKLKVTGANFKKSFIFSTASGNVDTNKQGAIGGVLFDADGKIVTNAAIKITDATATTTWETSSDTKGSFKVFVPAGSYKLFTIGQDVEDDSATDENEAVDYKNSVYDVKVSAGTMSSPLDDLNPKQAWAVNENKLGYDKLTFGTATTAQTINDITNATKEIKGTAIPNAVVSVYEVTSETLPAAPAAAPASLGVVNVSAAGNDGKITGTTTDMEYKLKTDTAYTAVTDTEIASLAPGEYVVRYAAVAADGTPASLTTAVTITDGSTEGSVVPEETPVPQEPKKTYTLVTSTVAKLDTIAKTGKFALKLPVVQPGKKLAIKVVDPAGNEYLDEMTSGTAKLTMSAPPNILAVPYSKDAVITLVDTNKLMTTANTKVKIGETVLTKTEDYTIVSGKLTLKAHVLNVGDNQITLQHDSFNDVSFKQVVGGNAQALTVSAVATGLTVDGTTKLNYSGVAAGNKVQYKISDATISTPKGGDAVTELGLSDLSADTKTISGVDAVANKYVGVYEVDANDKIVKFKLLTLTATSIKKDAVAPSKSKESLDESKKIITIEFSEDIFRVGSTAASLKSAIKLSTNGTTFNALATGDTVEIVGNKLVITRSTALEGTTNMIQVAASALQDKYTNKVATFKTAALAYVAPAATEVTLAEGSLGTAGNNEITGLTSAKKYKVTEGTTVSYVKADGTLGTLADVAALTGAKITGLTNGKTYKVEDANSVPTVATTITNQTGVVGTAVTVDATNTFADADTTDTLTLTAVSDTTATATVEVTGKTITITPLAAGTATITLTADDGFGGTVSTTFTITVTAS
ncbi:DUF1533 domain-containing protein [Domibacillus sp. A3M-37]|uniref:hemoblobin-interacting domain-containing protein n=1 Tax=Domibacillus sp. A3M-37 TaxID=2962037 RepID=UPI0020B646BA|nr:hemoblobin-interacting domain-containing protein [Domibacillus sp. A3M-37]MCP3761229.1 DUF1533 domain-containing protein [Domibacillus sp. A3M-37]